MAWLLRKPPLPCHRGGNHLAGWGGVWGSLLIYICGWVVSTPLKNISQLGWVFPIYGKIKNVPNHQPYILYIYSTVISICPKAAAWTTMVLPPSRTCFEVSSAQAWLRIIWGKTPKFGVWLSWFHIFFLQFWWFFIILSIIICFSF